MSNQAIPAALRALGFRATDAQIEALLAHCMKSKLGALQAIEQLVEVEKRELEKRNLATRERSSLLGTVPGLDQFDWSFPRQIDRTLYERLLRLEFIKTGGNVLFRGASGVGKTTLAQALGSAALVAGHTVRFSTLADAIADLAKAESIPALERGLKRYTKPSLLIIDEIGYLPCEIQGGNWLYTIISRRHEKRSTVLSTNLPYKEWSEVFHGAACVAALVDRFAQHCDTMHIEGDSWRNHQRALKEAKLKEAKLKKRTSG